MKNLANFLFEVGMLKRTPRSGHQFLGSGSESVAEHICRVIFIGYALAKLDGGADETKLLKMCFLHDLHEARTGDMNYMNKKYVSVDEDKALQDPSSSGDKRITIRTHSNRRYVFAEVCDSGFCAGACPCGIWEIRENEPLE